jgi:uncharacterized membrane protein YbaN (DUF454 family)
MNGNNYNETYESETCEDGAAQEKRRIKGPGRYILIALGVLSLGIGVAGVILPFLPSFPFFTMTLVCFTKSSRRLHDWFLATKLYKNHLEPFLHKKPVTWKTKLSMIASLTVLMGVGFYMMRNIPVGQVVLAAIWFAHVLFFMFKVKTEKGGKPSSVCRFMVNRQSQSETGE